MAKAEGVVKTIHQDVMVLKSNGDWHGVGSRDAYQAWLFEHLESLAEAADAQDAVRIRSVFQELVPEYSFVEASCSLVN